MSHNSWTVREDPESEPSTPLTHKAHQSTRQGCRFDWFSLRTENEPTEVLTNFVVIPRVKEMFIK